MQIEIELYVTFKKLILMFRKDIIGKPIETTPKGLRSLKLGS